MDEPTSRAERRAHSRGRSRVWVIAGGALVAVIAIALGAVLLSSGGGDESSNASKAPPVTVAKTNVTLAAGDVSADSVGAPVTVSPEVVKATIDSIGTYLKVATVDPLRSAKPAADLSAVFNQAALARVIGVDRSALVDEGLPQVAGELDVVATPVAITGLGDQDGKLALLTASINLDITGTVKSAAKGAKTDPLHIVRTGSFVFTPDANGAWKVSAYSIDVNRAGGGIDAPTSTTAATTGTAR